MNQLCKYISIYLIIIQNLEGYNKNLSNNDNEVVRCKVRIIGKEYIEIRCKAKNQRNTSQNTSLRVISSLN